MPDIDKPSGSIREFNANWDNRREAQYNHWIQGRPKNQIQLAFQSHFLLFKEIIAGSKYFNCLEVGSGRGTISSYFSDAGYSCTLLDTSASILDTAKHIFLMNNHQADFIQGNALDLPFKENSYDIVVSIGLLEHFEDIDKPLSEQFRILRKGGVFLGYIVPKRKDNIQKFFSFINSLLKFIDKITNRKKGSIKIKTDIFRSDYGSERYLPIISKMAVHDIRVMGVYPLPMISYSPEFPFSLLPGPIEIILTLIFKVILSARRLLDPKNPWICEESFGQAFLITFRKDS